MSEQAAAAALDQALVGVLSSVDLAFVISSARVPDCPVVYASQSFYTLTGYSAEETLGRNCRFLQQRHGHYAGGGNRKARTPPALGVPARAAAPRCVHGAALAYLCRLRCTDVRELTSAGATQVCEMRSALVEERDCQVRGGAGLGGASLADAHRPRGAHAPPRPAAAARAQVCVLNYRRDGTPFWNLCSMSPIVGADGAVDAYLGVQVDVTAQVLALAREAEAGAGLPAPGAALEAASLCARWRAAHFPAPSAVGRAGEGAYVHDACDGVADPAAPEKRRLRQLLARWHAAQQSGARPAARARRRGLQRQGARAGFRAVLPGALTSVASGLHRPRECAGPLTALRAAANPALTRAGQELEAVGRRLSGPVAAPDLPVSLQQPLMRLAQSFVLSDPALPDQPIVFASERFLELTGRAAALPAHLHAAGSTQGEKRARQSMRLTACPGSPGGARARAARDSSGRGAAGTRASACSGTTAASCRAAARPRTRPSWRACARRSRPSGPSRCARGMAGRAAAQPSAAPGVRRRSEAHVGAAAGHCVLCVVFNPAQAQAFVARA